MVFSHAAGLQVVTVSCNYHHHRHCWEALPLSSSLSTAWQSRHRRCNFGPLALLGYRSPSPCNTSWQKRLHANSRRSFTNTTEPPTAGVSSSVA
jgi:hypothetical protein